MKIKTTRSLSNNRKKAEGTEAEGRRAEGEIRFLYSEFLRSLF